MKNLSLGQLTAIDLAPEEYINIAAAAGVQGVSLLVNSPNPATPFPLVTEDNFGAVQTALKTSALEVNNVECFMLTPHTNIEHFREGFAIGQRLGARGATALLYDNDESRVKKHLLQLCELGNEYHLRINIEFMAMTPRWNTLEQAAQLIQEMDKPNLGLGIDLLHLIRSGGCPSDLAAIPAEIIYYAQLCDSADLGAHKDYAEEAGSHRLAPGDGQFPVRELIDALPDTAFLEIEVPQPSTTPARERVKSIVEKTRPITG